MFNTVNKQFINQIVTSILFVTSAYSSIYLMPSFIKLVVMFLKIFRKLAGVQMEL